LKIAFGAILLEDSRRVVEMKEKAAASKPPARRLETDVCRCSVVVLTVAQN
jgi:hypothetical protein